jgi:hypothetical protein
MELFLTRGRGYIRFKAFLEEKKNSIKAETTFISYTRDSDMPGLFFLLAFKR